MYVHAHYFPVEQLSCSTGKSTVGTVCVHVQYFPVEQLSCSTGKKKESTVLLIFAIYFGNCTSFFH